MIQPLGVFSPQKTFGNNKRENSHITDTERKIVFLNSVGISGITGALTTVIARNYMSTWRKSALAGLAGAIFMFLYVCPKIIFKAKPPLNGNINLNA